MSTSRVPNKHSTNYGVCMVIFLVFSVVYQECVTHCVERYPRLAGKAVVCNALRPEGADVVQSAAAFKRLAQTSGSSPESGSEATSAGCYVAFVDIGGDRHPEAVLELCERTLSEPPVLVIKCRLLYRAALRVLKDELGVKAPPVPEVSDGEARHQYQLQQPFELNEPRCSTFLAAWWRRLTDLTFESGGASGSAGLGKPLWQRKQPVEKAAVDRDAGECGTAAEGKPSETGPSTLLGNLRLGLPPAPVAFCVGSGGGSNELVAVGSLAADAKKEGTWPARDLESVLEGGPSEL